ncbi:hypothetical protein LTR37_006036 [Vermiconidia calcicola]|uniref:Uncharacterized protein n=1 Tax=Vermiconidia calcicola TaxID=1690605 RepID=A0ACC3NHJ5_9PEZI|nr:hypothetical protein LTR37_006036 [Vermiconidia calcicola]
MFNRAWCAGNDYDKAPETKQLQSSTMENSPFGRLAPELRNKIWALAVKKGEPIGIDAYDDLEPPITKVCRQIRNECRGMFYAENDFEAIFIYHKNKLLRRWIKVIGRKRLAVVRSLTVYYYEIERAS